MSIYEILGWLNVILFVLLVVKVPLKAINKKYRNKGLAKLIGILTKYHKYFGILMVISGIAHGILTGANIFSINSGSVLLISVILTAIFGILIKIVRKKQILLIHKILSIATLALIINHVLF